jgi:hypothetical protein
VLARQRRGPLVERERRGRGRRVVRVVQPQDRRALPDVRAHGVEVGEEAVGGAQRQLDDLLAGEHGPALVDGVGGLRHDDELAAEHLGEVEDRLLGAERRDDLRVRVQRRPEAAPHPAGDRSPQLRQPLGQRIRRQRRHRRGERLADERRRLLARLADAEVDYVDAVGLQPPPRLRQPHERVRPQPGEDGGEPHGAHASSTR